MLSVLMQCTLITAMVMVIWVVWGYSFAFGGSTSPYWGGMSKMFLAGVTPDSLAATFTDGVMIPEYLFIAFQMTFAAITPALIVGAFAERIKFSALMVFVLLWVTIVYFPIAHMVWDANGLIFNMGAIDFAGGTVVHINAGIAALAAVMVLGKRRSAPTPPHSMPLVMIGTGILWFGWFGFNAGSALAANGQAAQAFMYTFLAGAAGGLAWILIEWLRDGHPTNLGAASGIVSGLVAITPGAGYVSGPAPILIGLIAGAICCYAVRLKNKFGYDDALDVVGVHFVGGLVGSLLIGFFANPSFFEGSFDEGIFYGGGAGLLVEQAIANGAAIVWSFVLTFVIMMALKKTIGVRVSPETESTGLDLAEHGETAYHGAQ